MCSHDNTSETEAPVGQGLGYPLQVFTDHEFVATVPHTEDEEVNNKFIGNYCETCDICGETRCWCNSSDWGEELIDIENSTTNPTLEKTPSPEKGRKPPAGWVEHRRRAIQAVKENNRKIVIENCNTISREEFNNNSG